MPQAFSAILAASAGPMALFIDFDGTLVEIAPTPNGVHVPDTLSQRLDQLRDRLDGALAMVTGRPISDIDTFLPGQQLSVSGSHGNEQRHGDHQPDISADIVTAAAQIVDYVERTIGEESGILIEPKKTGVAVHYRAAPEKREIARSAVHDAIATNVDFDAIDGKMVVEARPRGKDKGSAIRALMQTAPFAGRQPIFIGDDVTDEDGFKAVTQLGGFGIKVGDGETAAKFRLPDIPSVYEYFEALIAGGHIAPSANSGTNTPTESMIK